MRKTSPVELPGSARDLIESGALAAQSVVREPQHPYTKALLSVVPRRDPHERSRPQILTGEAPDAVRIPSGCRFACAARS
jgi:peptide/nickel transport system ATP-binding protein